MAVIRTNMASRMLAFAAATAMALAVAAEPVIVRDAWVRATVPGQTVAGAYMDLTSAQPAALVAAETSAAARAELHTMAMEGGVMKMRPIEKIELPARQTVSLKPGGLHVMLVGVKREIRAGERIPLKLTVQDAKGARSTLQVEAIVKDTAGTGQSSPADHSSHK
jgi:copper(I)-binding protein